VPAFVAEKNAINTGNYTVSGQKKATSTVLYVLLTLAIVTDLQSAASFVKKKDSGVYFT